MSTDPGDQYERWVENHTTEQMANLLVELEIGLRKMDDILHMPLGNTGLIIRLAREHINTMLIQYLSPSQMRVCKGCGKPTHNSFCCGKGFDPATPEEPPRCCGERMVRFAGWVCQDEDCNSLIGDRVPTSAKRKTL